MIIAIDFDGTCVTHEFPHIGKDIGAIPVLKKLVEKGHKLILYTMRSDNKGSNASSAEFPDVVGGNYLSNAIEWFRLVGIPLHGIQTNPVQASWTSSPKCYAELYIDDAALGCPLKLDTKLCNRPFVNWQRVEVLLKEQQLI